MRTSKQYLEDIAIMSALKYKPVEMAYLKDCIEMAVAIETAAKQTLDSDVAAIVRAAAESMQGKRSNG